MVHSHAITTPVTPQLFPLWDRLLEATAKYRKIKESEYDEYSKYRLSNYWPRLRRIKQQIDDILEKGCIEAETDGDGKFRIEVPQGKYFLWTEKTVYGKIQLLWCKLINVQSNVRDIILDAKSAVQEDSQSAEDIHDFIVFDQLVQELRR